jgi:hypothetical protein
MCVRRRTSKSALHLNERGATIVMMALMLFLALGMSALAIDYGMVKATKAEAQRAVDAAALAGASAFLIANPDAIIADTAELRARDFAKKHQVHRVTVTDPEIDVDVDLPNEIVTVTYTGGAFSLWFARTFGVATMSIKAVAAAHAAETGSASCLMPIAIPDLWSEAEGGGEPVDNQHPPEDLNANGTWDWEENNGSSGFQWAKNDGADIWETWQYEEGEGDEYTDYSKYNEERDFGRPVVMMTFESKDVGNIPSNFYAWGDGSNDASAERLQERILDPDCGPVNLGHYGMGVDAGNGAKLPVKDAWDERIARAPSADWSWDEETSSIDCSGPCPKNLEVSPRIVTIGLYNPAILTESSDNDITFTNFAKFFLERRQCAGETGANGKCPLIGRFLGPVQGIAAPGAPLGTLVKRLVLIK